MFIEAGDIEGLADYVTDVVVPPEYFTWSIDEREIEVPPDPLLLTADGYRRGQIETLEAKCDCGANLYGIVRVHHCNEAEPEERGHRGRSEQEFCAKCNGVCRFDSDGNLKPQSDAA